MKTINIKEVPSNGNVVFRNHDIVIIDSLQVITEIPDNEVLIDGFLLMMIKKGHAEISVDGRNYELRQGCLFVCDPRNILNTIMVSVDFAVSGIFCTSSYGRWIMKEANLDITRYMIIGNHSLVMLNEEQQQLFSTYIDLTGKLIAIDDMPDKEKSLISLFQSMAFFFGYLNNEVRTVAVDKSMTSAELIFKRFIEMLNDSHGHVDNVNGYAERLNITPKYFSSICKKVSGNTASQIINDYIVREAKIRLHNPSLSIKQIANEMGFANSSHFGTFIRRNTGKNPQALRD